MCVVDLFAETSPNLHALVCQFRLTFDKSKPSDHLIIVIGITIALANVMARDVFHSDPIDLFQMQLPSVFFSSGRLSPPQTICEFRQQ